jgi:hypothetical protein
MTSIMEKRYFLCNGRAVKYADLYKHPHAHIIGDLRFMADEGRKVTAMARWEESMPTDAVPPIDPEIDVFIIGDARSIKCRHTGCGRHPRWEIGKAAISALLERVGLEYPEEDDDGGKETVGTTGRRDPHQTLQPQDG